MDFWFLFYVAAIFCTNFVSCAIYFEAKRKLRQANQAAKEANYLRERAEQELHSAAAHAYHIYCKDLQPVEHRDYPYEEIKQLENK